MSFKCKLYRPDSSFSCAAGKGYLESQVKMHGFRIESNKNEIADDIDYDAANLHIIDENF